MVCGKSPLTGGWGNANSGGTFGPEIKRVGFDAIFFKGKAEKPTYLFIDGKNIQLLDASELWGKDGVETEKIIEKKERHAVLNFHGGDKGKAFIYKKNVRPDHGVIF